jgi:predicted nucleic acid-binding protein
MLGPIRQEVLSGIKDIKQFRKLREALRFFPDVLVRSPDYELAADFFNRCRSLGIQGSNTDFLICAVAHSRKMPIYTTDKDFLQFKKHLQFSLI